MNKKNALGITLGLVAIAIYKSIGIENIPYQINVFIIILALMVMIYEVFKHKANKKEHNYLKIITSLLIALSLILAMGLILQNNYRDLSERYKPLIVALIIILFISLLITVWMNAIAVLKNKHNLK